MHTIMEELHKDHIHLEKVFKLLDQQVERLSTDDNPDYYLMLDITNYIQHYPDLVHHPKENRVYDIFIQRSEKAQDIVEQLQKDHQTLPSETIILHGILESVISSVVLVSRKEVQNQVQSFLEAQRKHMNLEEDILFPLINETLTEEDWKTLEETIVTKADPLFGDTLENSYEKLYQSIKRQGGID